MAWQHSVLALESARDSEGDKMDGAIHIEQQEQWILAAMQ